MRKADEVYERLVNHTYSDKSMVAEKKMVEETHEEMTEASRTALRGVIKRARTFQEMAPSQGEDGFV